MNLLAYLYHTKEKTLTYKSGKVPRVSELSGFTDSSHHNCLDSAKSGQCKVASWISCFPYSCFPYILEIKNTIGYRTVKHRSRIHCLKEIVWLRQMTGELGFKQKETKSSIDNSIYLSNRLQWRKWRNRWQIILSCAAYHWVREQVEAGEIYLEYVSSKENLTDVMTKIQARPLFDQFVKKFLS